jgi:hypothetical protein
METICETCDFFGSELTILPSFKTPKKNKKLGTRAFSSFGGQKNTCMTREENFVKVDG